MLLDQASTSPKTAWLPATREPRTPWLLAERVGDRQAAVTPECERGDLRPQRVLAALPFGAVNEPHHRIHRFLVEAVGEQVGTAVRVFDVCGEHPVE